MKALISKGMVHEVLLDPFPVASPMRWVPVPEGVLPARGWTFDGTTFAAPTTVPTETAIELLERRMAEDPLERAKIRRQARQEGISPRQVMDGIIAEHEEEQP